MMSTEQVMCRYYVQRARWEGNKCLFAHDLPTSKSSTVFKYYQKGQCAYSAWYRCDHMKLTALRGATANVLPLAVPHSPSAWAHHHTEQEEEEGAEGQKSVWLE